MRGTTKPVALIVTLSLTLALALVAAQGSFGADTTAELTTTLSTATETTPAASTSAETTNAPATTAAPRTTPTKTVDENTLSIDPRASQTTDPYAEVTIEAASKPGTSNVTPNSNPTGPPTQTAPGSEANEPSLLFGQGRQGVITVAAKYVLPAHQNPHGMTAGSFRVTTTLPAGLTYVRSSTAYEYDSTSEYGMSCTPDGQKVHCVVTTRSSERAAVLRSARTMRIFLVVGAANDLFKPDASDKTNITAALGDIQAEMSVETVVGTLTDQTTVPALASEGYQLPRLAASLQQIDNVGHKRVFRLVFHNIGGLPVVPVGKNASLDITEILPGKDPAIPFSVTGDGWTCDELSEKTTEPTRCTSRQRLELGAASTPLTVTWYPLSGRSAKERATYYDWTLSSKASWTTTEKIGGKTKRYGGQRCQTHPYRWRLRHLTPPRLDTHILAGKGLDIRQGGSQEITLRIGNIGQTPATNVGLQIALPTHTTLTTKNPAWTCTAGTSSADCVATGLSIQPGKRIVLKVTVSAADDAHVGHGRLRVIPRATADASPVGRSIPITIKDIGDPEATPTLQFARTGGGWRTWSNGSVTKVMVGEALSYRVQITNRGGNIVPEGNEVRISQDIGSGLSLINAEASNGGTCAIKPLVCTITTATSVAPGQQIGIVTITVVPRKTTKRAALGLITTTIEGEKGNETVPVPVKVIPTDRTLRVSSHIKLIPDVGGKGDIELRVTNLQPKGTSVENITVEMPLPKGIVVDSVDGNLWSCSIASGRTTCAFGATLPGRTKTPVAHITIKDVGSARATHKPAPLLWRAKGSTVGSGKREYGISHLRLPIRKAIRIAAEASPKSLAPSKRPKHLRSVVLTGSNSVGNGVSLDYQWKQRCTTAADDIPACARHGNAPAVRITSRTAAVARALVPSVVKRTTFVFELTISDGSSTQSQIVTVSAAPNATLEQGGEKRTSALKAGTASLLAAQKAAHQSAEKKRAQSAKRSASAERSKQKAGASNAKAVVANTAKVGIGGASLVLGAPGQELPLTVQILKGSGSHQIRWAQVAGTTTEIRDHTSPTATVRLPTADGVVAYTATVTNSAGQQSVAQVTVNVGPTTISKATMPQYCSLVTAVGPGKSVDLGPSITAQFGKVSAPPSSTVKACKSNARAATRQSTSGSFSGSSFSIGSLEVTRASGSYSPAGVEITEGTLTLPSSWNTPPLQIGSTPLSLVFPGNGQATQLSGSITTPSFAFLQLPTGWSGSTTLTFAPGDGGQTTGTATLSALDGNGGTVSMTGSVSTSGTFSLSATADNLITIGSTPLDLSGSVSNATGTTVSQITGSIAQPITLATGVKLTTLTTTWNGGGATTTGTAATPAVTGQAVIALQSGAETPTALNANLSYASTTNWNITVTASGGPTWQPISGLQVQPSDFSGAIAKANGNWQWDIEADIPTWNVTSILTLSDLKLDLSNSCASTTLICPAADMFMLISTDVALDAPLGVEVNAAASAVFGVGGKPGFSLYAGLTSDLEIAPGVSLGSPSFAVNYDLPAGTVLPTTGMPSFSSSSESGWNVNVLGSLSVPGLGSFGDIAANFSSVGISLGGWDPNGVSLGGSSNGTQSGTAFGWSSFAATMTATLPNFGVQTLSMQPGEFSIQGGYTAPTWWDQMTNGSLGMMLGTIQFDPETGFFNAKIDFGGGHSIPAGGSQLAVSSLFFDIQFNTTGLTVSAGGTTDLSITALGGSSQTAPTLTFEISFDIGTNALSGTLDFQDATGWNNAFGVDGLVIDNLAISLGITLDPPIPLPSLGLYASGDLPPSLMQAFGVDNGVPISMTADLSEATPCLAIAVGSSTGSTPIMDIGGGALTATYFEFSVAPDGCTVGTSTIPAGMSFAFDGAVFGTTVDVSASLQLDPTIFNASLKIGAFSIPGTGGAISFQNTIITVGLNTATNTDSVSFAGGFSMFGTTIDVSGSLTKTPDSVTASLQISQPQPLTVASFSLSNLMISLNVEYGPGIENLSVAAAGDMNIMGTILDVSMAATIDNGIVEYVDVSATLQNLTLGPATMNGSFNGSYTATTNNFDVNADVMLSVGGFSMQATLEISPQCVAFTGSLDIPSVFSAQLAGTMIYQAGCNEQVTNAAGTAVTGSPGDFSFAADNVALSVAGFDIGGSVGVGSVGGDFYATVAASVDLLPQGSNDEVSVQGAFQSNGDFSFNGQGELDIGGFMLQVQVAVASQGGNESISGSADLALAGIANVSIAGQFTMNGGQESIVLTGSENISMGGFNISNAQFTLSETPTAIGLQASLAINLDVVSVNGTLTFIENGNAPPLYYLAADGDLNIGVADLVLNAIFTNCTDSSCSTPANATSLTMTGDATIFGTAFNLPTFFISSDGIFSISSSSSGSACTGTMTIPLITQLQGCFAYTEYLDISNVAPYFATTDTATLSVNGDRWNFSDGPEECCCKVCWWMGGDCTQICIPEGGWTSWSSLGSFSAGIEFTADPFSLGIELFGTWFTI